MSIPNKIIVNHVLKKTLNMYILAKPSIETASKVEKPPWNTLDPI